MSFCGKYFHQMDAKKRIRIPAKLRADLGKEYYFVVRPQGCIGVYPKAELDRLIEKFDSVTTGDPRRVAAKRRILSSVEKVVEDEQGRVLVPTAFREYAHLDKEIVTTGMGNIIEIWAKDAWEAAEQEMSIDDAFLLSDV